MDMSPLERRAVNPLAAWDRVQRMSEPWYMTKAVVVGVGLLFAVILSYLAATGDFETLILVAVWVLACLIIVFVRDYWWAPALIITALSVRTLAGGFMLTGLEVGVVILALTFPVKLAMKTLRPAGPKMYPGPFYWALLGFVIVHAVVIYYYSKIDGAPQIKNIVKSYYGAIAPLILYGLLVRYCNPKTVFPTCKILFFVWFFVVLIAIPVTALGIQLPGLTNLKITFDFLTAGLALGPLRGTSPYLLVAAIAFWPVARSQSQRFLLGSAAAVAILGVLIGAGRAPTASCFLAAAFFAVVRNRIWLALPVILVVGGIACAFTVDPEIMYSLPGNFQRALTPLNFSDEKTEAQMTAVGSDQYHDRLRTDSIAYWNQDTTSFFLGHGYKSWDDSLDGAENLDLDTQVRFGVEMGATETMLYSLLNIFGLAGVVLYGALLIYLAFSLWRARGRCPEESPERAICEFSFVLVATAILLSPLSGGFTGITIIYWLLGILAARPYIGMAESAAPVPAAAFDLSRQILLGSDAPKRGDPLAAFAKRQARFRKKMSGSGEG